MLLLFDLTFVDYIFSLLSVLLWSAVYMSSNSCHLIFLMLPRLLNILISLTSIILMKV